MMLDLLMTAGAAAQSLGGPDGIWAHIVHDFSNITEPAALSAFLPVLMIDVVLAGDNAIGVGALAAGLPADQRQKLHLIACLAAQIGKTTCRDRVRQSVSIQLCTRHLKNK